MSSVGSGGTEIADAIAHRRDLTVLDVSSGGAFVQGKARLLPRIHVDVRVITAAGRASSAAGVSTPYG